MVQAKQALYITKCEIHSSILQFLIHPYNADENLLLSSLKLLEQVAIYATLLYAIHLQIATISCIFLLRSH